MPKTVTIRSNPNPDPDLQRALTDRPPVQVRFKRLRENARMPTYATDGSSGMDGYASEFAIPGRDEPWPHDSLVLHPDERVLVRLGIACEIPPGYEIQVRPRSGLALRDGVVAIVGTVDADYRGEIGATLVNLGDRMVHLLAGDRVCQLVLAPVSRAELVEVEELGETARGTGGFGSTGR